MSDCLKTITPRVYADDDQIFSSSYNFDSLIEDLNPDLNNVQNLLAKNKLQPHPTKSRLCLLGHHTISTMRSVTILFY